MNALCWNVLCWRLSRLMMPLLLLAFSWHAAAVIETYEFSDPSLAERYRQLSAELRCPKCQNQNIADSNAPIAQDLRKRLHQQLEEGASDEQILADMVGRYGEFVRYRPRFGGPSLVLWLAPVCLLVLGMCVAFLAIRRRTSAVGVDTDVNPDSGLSAQEQERISRMLAEEDKR